MVVCIIVVGPDIHCWKILAIQQRQRGQAGGGDCKQNFKTWLEKCFKGSGLSTEFTVDFTLELLQCQLWCVIFNKAILVIKTKKSPLDF